jgi:ribosome-binding protein aMBF1 (putative translation factor)
MTNAGYLIKKTRLAKGLTQTKLSKMCKLKAPAYISTCEDGTNLVSFHLAKKLCKILKIEQSQMRQALFLDWILKFHREWERPTNSRRS